MSATVVLGSQFGDEGKGKLVDMLLSSGKYRLVARCAGVPVLTLDIKENIPKFDLDCFWHNAGHTLVVDGQKYDFHILPSGLVAPGSVNVIGNGVVVHPPQFFQELKDLQAKGIQTDGRIFISDRAHVLFKLHRAVDGLREKALGKSNIGTTGNGIGPCYADKAARSGCQIWQIMDKESFDGRLKALADKYQREFGDSLQYNVEEEIKEFDGYRESLKPFVVDSFEMVDDAQEAGNEILIEAANALCLDIDAGTYPYVTSSNTGIAGVISGLVGIRLESLTRRIGVVKAYSTRVGSGPLPTEDFAEVGNKLQEIGREFGTTTGRRRRYTELNITKLDVLDSFPTLKVAVAYHSKTADGTQKTWRKMLPADLRQLDRDNCEVEYVELPGWQQDITGCRSWNELPQKAKQYVDFIEHEVGVPVRWIGVGPEREAMIERAR